MNRKFLLSSVLGLAALTFAGNAIQAQSYFYGYYYPDEQRFSSMKMNAGLYTYRTVTPMWNALHEKNNGTATGTPYSGQDPYPSPIMPSGSGGYNTTPERGFGTALSRPDLVPSPIMPSGSGGYNTTPERGFGRPLVPSSRGQALRSVTIRVIVPNSQATVFFGDHQTKATGMQRVFQSPPINSGTYDYQIKVAYNQGGQQRTQERTITVSPGQSVVVDFSGAVTTPQDR